MRSCVLTINGGSSSIRFAVYEAGTTPRRRLAESFRDRAHLERIQGEAQALVARLFAQASI